MRWGVSEIGSQLGLAYRSILFAGSKFFPLYLEAYSSNVLATNTQQLLCLVGLGLRVDYYQQEVVDNKEEMTKSVREFTIRGGAVSHLEFFTQSIKI
jgi:hypothetical protein